MKICARCYTTKESDQFDKHRAVCKTCRNLYHKNRREDLKDGKRDEISWYEAHKAMENATIIKELEQKLDRKIAVLQIPERELRCSEDFSHSWFCFRWTMYTVIIIFGVLNANWGWI